MGSSGSFSEAVTSLQNSLSIRTSECERLKSELDDTRSAARREQRLMLSAWYELGMKVSTNGSGDELFPNKNESASWLRQQRRKQRREGLL